MSIDFSVVIQGVFVAFLGAVGWVLWQTSTTLAALKASFDAHTRSDEAFQEEIRAALPRTRRRS